MSNIYDMVEKTPEQLKTETKPEEQSSNSGSQFEEEDYVGINVDVDTLQRNTKTYTVIAKDEVPEDVKATLGNIINRLTDKEWTLRINPEDRNNSIAKFAYIKASIPKEKNGEIVTFVEVYMPWAKMNPVITPVIKKPTTMAHRVAIWMDKQLYKSDETKYNAMKSYFKAFAANKTHVLLGEGCNAAIDFAIIYTPCGITSTNMETDAKKVGYDIVRMIRLSKLFGFRIFNIGSNESVMELEQYMASVVEGTTAD